MKKQVTSLDLGCGNRKRPGYIGIDINPRTGADVVHDLNVFPYPFAGDTFDEIIADNVIEHLAEPVRVMEELHRISKADGRLIVKVPYFRSMWAFIDPTHRHFFTVDSFSYYDPRHENNRLYNYSTAFFQIERVIFNAGIHRGPVTELVKALANRWPGHYELYLSHLYPLDELTFHLRAVKAS
jgi:SAM-dependent methyltransferase